jgi:integrase
LFCRQKIVAELLEGKMPMAPVVQLRSSQSEKPTVAGGRKPNAAFRSREYLTEPEIERLRKAARKNRNPVRDELLILLAFRHALRVSELVGLTVEQFDLKAATVHIRRAKNGTPGIHGLQGDELRLIRQLIREKYLGSLGGTRQPHVSRRYRRRPAKKRGSKNSPPNVIVGVAH